MNPRLRAAVVRALKVAVGAALSAGLVALMNQLPSLDLPSWAVAPITAALLALEKYVRWTP